MKLPKLYKHALLCWKTMSNGLKDLDLDARLASIETSLKYIESLLKDLKDKK